MKIESVRKLLTVLERAPKWGFQMFRGQTRDWMLLPSIGRYPAVAESYASWRSLHEQIIENFLRLGHQYLSGYSTAGADSWVLGQHHGLPTRLLDTTTNPLKALFFAVNQPAEDEHDGVLWVFDYSGWITDLHEGNIGYLNNKPIPFLPAQLNPRLTAQEGAFISYPLPNNNNPLKPIDKLEQGNFSCKKFIIPAAAKNRLRNELEVLGVQYRLLFPDLDGIARSIKMTELRA